MKSHKTKQENRGTYTYIFDDGTKITIKPGEKGVTEEFIKKLHSLDDSEVYYNHKNWHRPISEKEKQDIIIKGEIYGRCKKTEYADERCRNGIRGIFRKGQDSIRPLSMLRC